MAILPWYKMGCIDAMEHLHDKAPSAPSTACHTYWVLYPFWEAGEGGVDGTGAVAMS